MLAQRMVDPKIHQNLRHEKEVGLHVQVQVQVGKDSHVLVVQGDQWIVEPSEAPVFPWTAGHENEEQEPVVVLHSGDGFCMELGQVQEFHGQDRLFLEDFVKVDLWLTEGCLAVLEEAVG